MTMVRQEAIGNRRIRRAPHLTVGVLAGSGVAAALAASSCCVLPLLLVLAGLGGEWVGALTRMSPYQPIFLMLAAGCIACGFWSLHRRSQAACDGQSCGTTRSRRLTKAALWAGTVILLVVATAGWWARLLA